MPDFQVIVEQFAFEGEFLDAAPYGTGHINDTYAARFRRRDGTTHRYILQKINTQVFKSPEKVMHNIQRVTEHLRSRITQMGGNPARAVLTIIPTRDGDSYHVTPTGEYWRAEVFIEGAQTYLTAQRVEHYSSAARAFGEFQRLLDDFPIGELHETIPDFHHTYKRIQAFTEAVERDIANRAATIKPEIDFVLERAQETNTLVDMVEKGEIPQRVTHNDTKLDNVMIDDASGEGICVIDLDTVMPGLAVFDFGDTVRSCANKGLEDERDLSKVGFDLTVFDRLVQGFLEPTRAILTPPEIDQLAFGARLITLEQSIRFLTDYLSGDTYFKTHRPGHNLERARTQIHLVREMERKFEAMLRTVERHRSGSSNVGCFPLP